MKVHSSQVAKMNGEGLPVGLTVESFADILREESGRQVRVTNVSVDLGSTAGDNNLSEIRRIVVKYAVEEEERSVSYIVKDVTKGRTDFVAMVYGMEKESSVYLDVLPRVERLLGGKDKGIGARCYTLHKDYMLLQDLCSLGYKLRNRLDLLDMDHCIQAVRALAKFHAATHHLDMVNGLPEITTRETLYVPENEQFLQGAFRCYEQIASNLSDWSYDEYSRSVRELGLSANRMITGCLKLDRGFRVLVHGDYWTTNILFKYDDSGKVSDAKIVDYQLVRYSVPTYDLHFFLATSMQPRVRDAHLDEILTVYLDTLNSTLKLIGSNDRLSRQRFIEMWEETYFVGIHHMLAFLPIPLCQQPLVFDPPPELDDKQKKLHVPFKPVYKQANYKEHLLSLLEFYKKKNAL